MFEEFKTPYFEYDDIDPHFREYNKMTRADTSIDCSDLISTIVQCKLRKNVMECSTFFASQNIYNKELNKTIVRWNNLIITRNSDCMLSRNLLEKNELFIDRSYDKQELIIFCEKLIDDPPTYPMIY